MSSTPTPTPTPTPILVAVDASAESLAALKWAIEFAAMRNHHVRAVTAVSATSAPRTDSAGGYYSAQIGRERQAVNRVRLFISGPLQRSGLSFEHIVTIGSIDRVLARHSHDAELAVVGTRQFSGWRRVLRRSITHRLTGRLACPLVSIAVPSSRPQISTTHHRAAPLLRRAAPSTPSPQLLMA